MQASDGSSQDDDRTAARLRQAISVATMIMLVVSWPLWVGNRDFPRIPFVRDFPAPTGLIGWTSFLAILISQGWVALGLRFWRLAGLVSIALISFLILGDQNRLQTWIYQDLLALLALIALPGRRAVVWIRAWIIGIYIYSGLSKLDVTFSRELGPVFLEASWNLVGQTTSDWSNAFRSRVSLLLPLAELLIGLGLIWPRSRRPSFLGAIVLHVLLIAILGPWRLGHSAIVLLWNSSLIVLDGILFAAPAGDPDVPPEKLSVGSVLVQGILGLALILPLGERFELWDAWPSNALYASHLEKVDIFLPGDDLSRYPESIQRHVLGREDDDWRRLDLTGWCREVQGAPCYPQSRVALGLAEWLASRYRGPRPIRVVRLGTADRISGKRLRFEVVGLEAIRRMGRRFWINPHPAPGV